MNSTSPKPFWETKTLAEMSPSEWESLCDGCGLCCVIRFEDEDTGQIIPTRVHCKLFDPDRCTCIDYAQRQAEVPDCVQLTPDNIERLKWMPLSCAYRRLHEGRTLAWTTDMGPHWLPQEAIDWAGFVPLWRNLLGWLCTKA